MLIVVLVVTVLFVLFLRTNPTGREFFDPAGTLIAVKLLRKKLVAMSECSSVAGPFDGHVDTLKQCM